MKHLKALIVIVISIFLFFILTVAMGEVRERDSFILHDKSVKAELIEFQDAERIILKLKKQKVFARPALMKPVIGQEDRLKEEFESLKGQALRVDILSLKRYCDKDKPFISVAVFEEGKKISFNEELLKEGLLELDPCLIANTKVAVKKNTKDYVRRLKELRPDNQELKDLELGKITKPSPIGQIILILLILISILGLVMAYLYEKSKKKGRIL